MMLPSMWTSYLIQMYPLEMARTLARHGWQTCELSDEHGHDLLKMGSPGKVGAAFRSLAGDLGVTFPQGHFYLCNKGFRPEDRDGRQGADIAPRDDRDFQAAMDDMKRWVELFAALGVRAGVLHCGGQNMLREGIPLPQVFERRCQAVAAVADFAAGTGVTICLENLKAPGTMTCGDLLGLIAAVNRPNVAICLDTGHANICQVDVPDFIRQAKGRLKALHIADNLGQNDDHMLPCGKGTVPWPAVMAALRDVSYDGLFNFEVPGESHCPLPIRLAKLDYARILADEMLKMAP
ncbi:MAG: sugar phosphate isomerase/epimerase [Lentisphaeria bacterium]|nr:sugar phosphate isomerase/epimerase [Lentisphaeria bacterium]